MSIWYGIACVISIVLLIVCTIFYRKENKWLFWLFLAVTVTDFGYFALSVSPNVEIAMVCNSIAYCGSVFLPIFILLIIANLCRLEVPRRIMLSMFCFAIVIFVIATSGWYSDVYYTAVDIGKVGNATVLIKEYGVLHPVYKVYIIAGLLAMIGVLAYSFVRKTDKNIGVSIYLSVLVAINIGIWFVETVFKSYFEFLSISYILTEILLLLFYSVVSRLISQLVTQDQSAESNEIVDADTEAIVYFDNINIEDLDIPGIELLSDRERDVFTLMLSGKKRKDIAQELYVSESTIKKHSSSIYKKLGVENKKGLMEKVNTVISK
ncbi:MAG: LuxR C-terminal-related transcriptional regulator [Eubacterium sp.]